MRFTACVAVLALGCVEPATEVSPPRVASPRPGVAPSTPSVAAALPMETPQPDAPAPRRAGAYANVDPTDDYVEGPPDLLPDCEDQLAKAGVTFKESSLPVHTEHRGKLTCGAPQVVLYLKGPGAIAYDPAPILTCSMALALASFEHILQEESDRIFHSQVARIGQLGTYSCRVVAAYPGTVSEHAYANAIDLARFTLKSGATITVAGDFDKGADTPRRTAGAFLRVVSQRANDEDVFSHVLTPFFNASHRDHFHLDLARFRADGTRPES